MRALYCTRITKDKTQFMPFAREWDGIQHPRREENTNVVGADTGREDQAGIPHAATPPLSQERELCGASAKRSRRDRPGGVFRPRAPDRERRPHSMLRSRCRER